MAATSPGSNPIHVAVSLKYDQKEMASSVLAAVYRLRKGAA